MDKTTYAQSPRTSKEPCDSRSSVLRVPLRVASTLADVASAQPIRVGVPCQRGSVSGHLRGELTGPDGEQFSAQLRTLATWPDGSAKWVLAESVLPALEPGETHWTLELAPESTDAIVAPLHTECTSRHVRIRTGSHEFRIDLDRNADTLLTCHSNSGETLGFFGPSLADANQKPFIVRWQELSLVDAGEICATVVVQGQLQKQRDIHLEIRLTFYASYGLVRGEVALHNARAAKHAGGLWDLGDPASLLFGDCSVVCQSPRHFTEATLQTCVDRTLSVPAAGGTLVQHSSGGRNWRSRNHIDRQGRIPQQQWGYDWQTSSSGNVIGNRASPTVCRRDANASLVMAAPEFWQQFPKSLEILPRELRYGMFPAESAQDFELQPGESKHHEVWLRWDAPGSSTVNDLNWVHAPASVMAIPQWHAASGCWSCMLPATDDCDERLATVLTQAVAGPQSFFAKRETVDEFGWRNYGDVWGDHENAFNKGPQPVISHYNNQFDLVLGSLLQWIRTQDDAWWQIAAPLARHVVDIDIYRTTQDKSCYNGGLFWHTDHYVSAASATHRTYSRHNQPADGRPYGGGPSNEHNYATGLLYYHYLTGCPAARRAAIGLAEWVINMDNGRLAPWRWLDTGPTGHASRTRDDDYHGPGRGAGNSLNALLDAWELARERRFIDFAETLIARCIHPHDDVPQCELLDVERRWSYPVFLVAVHRYLQVKSQEHEIDERYAYAQQSLLTYAKWMLANEQLYLDRAEELEYVTETWAAQDLRKANALRLAALHADEELSQHLRSKAEELSDAAWDALLTFPSMHVTRSIAITAVEGTRDFYLRTQSSTALPSAKSNYDFGAPTPFVPSRSRIKQRLKSPRGWLALAQHAWRALRGAAP